MRCGIDAGGLIGAAEIGFGGRRLEPDDSLFGNALSSLATLFGVAVFCFSSLGILLCGMWLTARPPRFRSLIPPREALGYELCSLALGIVAAEFLLNTPLLLPVVLVLVAVLHRSSVVKALQHAARTDAKTGLLTATAWREAARAALTRTDGDAGGITVLLLDLVLLESPGPRVAEEIAERLCAAVRDLRVEDVSITVSIGVSHHARGSDDGKLVDTLLREADAALYEAKQAGRDQVRKCSRATVARSSQPPQLERRHQ